LSISVNYRILNELAFPGFVLSLKQDEEDADTGFLCGELLHDLHTPHSSKFASLALEVFYFAVLFLAFYEFIKY